MQTRDHGQQAAPGTATSAPARTRSAGSRTAMGRVRKQIRDHGRIRLPTCPRTPRCPHRRADEAAGPAGTDRPARRARLRVTRPPLRARAPGRHRPPQDRRRRAPGQRTDRERRAPLRLRPPRRPRDRGRGTCRRRDPHRRDRRGLGRQRAHAPRRRRRHGLLGPRGGSSRNWPRPGAGTRPPPVAWSGSSSRTTDRPASPTGPAPACPQADLFGQALFPAHVWPEPSAAAGST